MQPLQLEQCREMITSGYKTGNFVNKLEDNPILVLQLSPTGSGLPYERGAFFLLDGNHRLAAHAHRIAALAKGATSAIIPAYPLHWSLPFAEASNLCLQTNLQVRVHSEISPLTIARFISNLKKSNAKIKKEEILQQVNINFGKKWKRQYVDLYINLSSSLDSRKDLFAALWEFDGLHPGTLKPAHLHEKVVCL